MDYKLGLIIIVIIATFIHQRRMNKLLVNMFFRSDPKLREEILDNMYAGDVLKLYKAVRREYGLEIMPTKEYLDLKDAFNGKRVDSSNVDK